MYNRRDGAKKLTIIKCYFITLPDIKLGINKGTIEKYAYKGTRQTKNGHKWVLRSD